jgi:hypothetical protein
MTATSLTYLAAREHINELMRDAERRRRIAGARSPRRVRLSIPRVFARRAPKSVQPGSPGANLSQDRCTPSSRELVLPPGVRRNRVRIRGIRSSAASHSRSATRRRTVARNGSPAPHRRHVAAFEVPVEPGKRFDVETLPRLGRAAARQQRWRSCASCGGSNRSPAWTTTTSSPPSPRPSSATSRATSARQRKRRAERRAPSRSGPDSRYVSVVEGGRAPGRFPRPFSEALSVVSATTGEIPCAIRRPLVR